MIDLREDNPGWEGREESPGEPSSRGPLTIPAAPVAYDGFAWFYNRYWGPDFCHTAMAIYEQILFPHLRMGAEVLDLCCGTGQIAAALVGRGYHVTGLDGSVAMLAFARQNAPAASFVQADARAFTFARPFDLVLSSFDSLNHLLTQEDLAAVFRCVAAVLPPGGLFLFDLNLEEEKESQGSSFDLVAEDHVCIVRSTYQPLRRFKRYDLTLFTQNDTGAWERSDLTLTQRYHEVETVRKMLLAGGFSEPQLFDARQDFGPRQRDCRLYYLARKGEPRRHARNELNATIAPSER
ncbi:MAG: class I SAM-dependent methyltransferase [Blastocatellia bacterium]|jgi:SAM-dependent methyltransferase